MLVEVGYTKCHTKDFFINSPQGKNEIRSQKKRRKVKVVMTGWTNGKWRIGNEHVDRIKHLPQVGIGFY